MTKITTADLDDIVDAIYGDELPDLDAMVKRLDEIAWLRNDLLNEATAIMRCCGVVSVKDAADRLGVSESRVKKMVADRVLRGWMSTFGLYVLEMDVDYRVAFVELNGMAPRKGERLV